VYIFSILNFNVSDYGLFIVITDCNFGVQCGMCVLLCVMIQELIRYLSHGAERKYFLTRILNNFA